MKEIIPKYRGRNPHLNRARSGKNFDIPSVHLNNFLYTVFFGIEETELSYRLMEFYRPTKQERPPDINGLEYDGRERVSTKTNLT